MHENVYLFHILSLQLPQIIDLYYVQELLHNRKLLISLLCIELILLTIIVYLCSAEGNSLFFNVILWWLATINDRSIPLDVSSEGSSLFLSTSSSAVFKWLVKLSMFRCRISSPWNIRTQDIKTFETELALYAFSKLQTSCCYGQ